jgi:DNA-binding transcriptional LysR family regulator
MSEIRGMPDLQTIELLTTVAETGSLGRAATRHGITQPAASLRLRNLERSLGLMLLDRSPVGSTLTAAGVAVVDWGRPLLDAAITFTRGVDALRETHHDRLRVAASLTVADHLVPAWLVALHAALPDVMASLQVTNSSHVAELVRGRAADLGFVESPQVPAGVRARVVGGDELVVITAPSHPWARRKRPLTPAEVAGTPLVLREPGSGTREALEHALAAHGQTVTAALQLGSTTAIKAAVAAGEGPAVLSHLTVTHELATGQLASIPVTGLDLRRHFHAIWRTGRAPTGTAGLLLAVIARGRSLRTAE